MVAIARYLNVTLIVPELDKTSFWADPRYVTHSLYLKFPNVFSFREIYIIKYTSILGLEIYILPFNEYLWSISEFQDIFDEEHFITSLRDEVRILKELPPRLKQRVELGMTYTMPPVSWSDISYYHNQVSSLLLFLVLAFLRWLPCLLEVHIAISIS